MMIKCALDEDQCIDLLTVLRVINQINQDQAWAICYELGVLMQRLAPNGCAPIESLAQIQMHKDGFVHEKSCSIVVKSSSSSSPSSISPSSLSSSSLSPQPPLSPPPSATTTETILSATIVDPQNDNNNNLNQTNNNNQQQPAPPTPPITPELNEVLRRRPALNESELVASLGIALFWALDYGIPDDEERKLSIAMEYLIFQSQSKLSLNELLEICINRLPIATKSHADSHYRDTCKSLISDTIELSIFLEKIYTASMVLSDITLDDCLDANHKCDISDEDLSELGEPLASLRALRINDWARLWMQVIRELRQRGKFKQALSVN